MEVRIAKKALRDALTVLGKVVPSKAKLPVLEGVRFDASDGAVSITATNLEERLSLTIPGAEGFGSFIIGFKALKEFVAQGSSRGEVAFGSNGASVRAFYFENEVMAECSFDAFPLNQWPEAPRSGENSHSVLKSFFETIAKAAPSVSNDPSRKVLQNILLDDEAVVATDGSQLVKFDVATGMKSACLFPVTKFVASKLFASGDGWIGVDDPDDPKWFEFRSKAWRYSVRLTEGTYPDYSKVIPKGGSRSLELSSKSMERLRESIPLLHCSKDHQTINIHAANGEFRVMPEKLENAGVAVECGFKGSAKEPFVVSVDRRLLLRALALGLSVFKWTDGDPYAPVTATDENGSVTFLFMPLRGGNAERIKKAAVKFGKISNGGKALKVDDPKTYDETGGSTEMTKESRTNEKEKRNMSEENKANGFKVVEGTEREPFEEMLSAIFEARGKAKEVYDSFGPLAKGIKDLQRRERAKEREFKSTRELLGKLKKVSGF